MLIKNIFKEQKYFIKFLKYFKKLKINYDKYLINDSLRNIFRKNISIKNSLKWSSCIVFYKEISFNNLKLKKRKKTYLVIYYLL